MPEDGSAFVGEAAISTSFNNHFAEPADAEAHRLKTAKTRRCYLEEECE